MKENPLDATGGAGVNENRSDCTVAGVKENLSDFTVTGVKLDSWSAAVRAAMRGEGGARGGIWREDSEV